MRIILIVTIVLGALARFTYLDTKVYSHDETLTALRSSGYLESEFRAAVAGHTETVANLQTYQHANTERNLTATVRALAVDDPQHPPLYYILERSWDKLLGGSIAARRSLGAIFGLLTIPATFWLCRELLARNKNFALLATALFAISPFELEYTQQTREYTLWGLITVISSALFIRAWRSNTVVVWIAYAVALALGMYAHTFFVFVIASHAATAIYLTLRHHAVHWRGFILACLAAGCAYAPWAYNLLQNTQTVQATNTWFAAAIPLPVYLYKLAFNAGAVFFDAEYANMLLSIVLVPLIALISYAVIVVVSAGDMIVGAFVVSLLVCAVAPLVGVDILHHESRATAARYMLPAFIAINLAVAYMIAIRLEFPGRSARFAIVTTCVLLVLGATSWIASARATSWYTASSDAPVLVIAHNIEGHPGAVILTNDSMLALQLSNYLPNDVRFVIDNGAPADFSRSSSNRRFVLEPTASECAALARDRGLALRVAYEPEYVDSPMLHMSFMDSPLARPIFSALRRRMVAIHGDATGMFRLMQVEAPVHRHTPLCDEVAGAK